MKEKGNNDVNYSLDRFIDYENAEQKDARHRIMTESEVPITDPHGTGKSTVISHCCFDLLSEYSPVLVTAPTNVMVNSTLAKIDLLLRRYNVSLWIDYKVRKYCKSGTIAPISPKIFIR
jgi:reverse gyrase